MSAVGAFVAKVVGSVGGPVVTGAIVVGGIAAGAVGGGLIASGGGQQASAGSELAVYPCPNTGPQIAVIKAGQQVLATGRNADSTWLRIHFPEPGRAEAWVEAGPLTVDGATSSLPVADCIPELAIAAPSTGAQESNTPTGNNPPSAPPATATPTIAPTATPNSRPTVASLTASTNQVSFDPGGYCPTAIKKVTFKVRAADTGGVTGVALFWRKPGSASFTETPMSRIAGTTANGTWQVTLDTTANGITSAGSLAYYAQATDAGNATRRIPVATSNTIQVKVCQNTGPTITNVGSSSGNSIWEDPFGVGKCQTASNITAVIKDPDGVASATLLYRKPGAAAFSSKPMNSTTVKGKWYANLDTLGDKISIVAPPTGQLRYSIRATDRKGAVSQSPQRVITVRRCDSEAGFDGVFPTNPNNAYPCTSAATLTIGTYASDDDQPNNGLIVTFHWTLSNPRTGAGPISGTMKAGVKQGVYYQGTSKAFDGKTYYAGVLTVWAVTLDKYGGTTTSSRAQYSMSCN